MAQKTDLRSWVTEALTDLGGEAHHVRVAEYVWSHHQDELRDSGDLFYTWQYDLRWAAQRLRDDSYLEPIGDRRDGVWRLVRA